MRDPDEDGFLDYPEATVWDAYEHYEGIMDTRGLNSAQTNSNMLGKENGAISITAPPALLEHMLPMIGIMFGSLMAHTRCKLHSVLSIGILIQPK